ncbi:MAG: tripartite tricarboxylate transporter TctB family protein [Ardenticatenaceae bacterium]
MKGYVTDRITGVLLLLFGIWYTWIGSALKAPILGDVLGPAAFPTLLGVLLCLLSIYLIVRPDPDPDWPTDITIWIKLGLIILSFVAYAYLIKPLGFMLATTLEMIVLSYLFDGPRVKSIIASIVFSVFLFILFNNILALGLPTGEIFKGLGG